MIRAPRPPFRLRYLLNPFFVFRRCRELGSAAEILRAASNIPDYVRSRYRSKFYDPRVRPLSRPPAAPVHARPTAAPPSDAPALEDAMGPATLRDAEVLAERFRSAQPFKHVVIDDFLDSAFCRRLLAEFPPYDAEKFRNEHGHLGKAHHENVPELGPSYRRLHALLQSPAFLGLVSRISGIPDLVFDPTYTGGGTHENLEEMELDPHVDFTVHRTTGLHRRVNMLLYLNPEWDESWGGGLELHVDPWLPPDQNPVKTISPAFNRCVIFEVHDRSWHGFKTITLPKDKPGLSRRSFALYLYTREKADGAPMIPEDLTVFVSRPLPPEFHPGRQLTEEDVRVLQHLIVRRDWKLRYLYRRAIALYNDWAQSQKQLKESLEAPTTKVR